MEDRLLEMVGEYMHKLQSINLEYCRRLTDPAVLRLLHRLPSLLKIDIQNTQISERTKQIIFEELSSRSLHAVLA